MSNKSLHQLYTEHTGKVSDKWSLYLSEYDRLFNSYRDKPIRLLEIGIQNGGSLEIWSKFFKNASTLIGCDSNPDCELLNYDDSRIKIIIGDANSPEVRERLLQLSPQFDIIVDDGSHLSSDIIKSFVLYFPLVAEGGVFIVEDLHCSYWSQFEGGLFDPYSSISLFKHLADVINHQHWGIPKARSDILRGIFTKYDIEISADVLSQVHSVEFINSMCVIRKATTTHNGLGNRVIAGSIELVVPRLKSKIHEPYSIFEQSDNPWSTRSKPPGEEIQLTEQLLTNTQRQIANLNHTVAERDGQITSLNLTVAERDMQIIHLNNVVAKIYNSTSWRITRPMRKVALEFKRAQRVVEFGISAIKLGGGLKNTLKKAVQLYRREGVAGIRRGFEIVATSGQVKPSPSSGEYDRNDYVEWIRRYDTLTDEKRADIRACVDAFEYKPLISVVMPVYNVKPEWLIEAIESLRGQVYPYWELCIADDASTDKDIRLILERYLCEDSRIKVVFREKNGHISEASNSALGLAEGEWVALLDHDDRLAESALFRVAELLQIHPEADLIYSDEDKITESGLRFGPYFKTDWNLDLFYSHNMFCHLGIYRKKLLNLVNGFRKGFEGAQDYDLVLRCIEKIDKKNIFHLPYVLYHWRYHDDSTAKTSEAKPYAMLAGERALNDHFVRMNIKGSAELIGHGYRLRYFLEEPYPLVSIIILTKDKYYFLKKCIESILKKTLYKNYEIILIDNSTTEIDALNYINNLSKNKKIKVIKNNQEFNFSKLNNIGVENCSGEFVCLLNNDTEVISPNWLYELTSIASQPNVGVVGAKLLYSNNSIQHAGIICGINGWAGHSHKGQTNETLGYCGRVSLISTFSAVTGACMLIKKSLYQEVGGLDEENLKIACSDVDFCLKLGEAGFRSVYTPYAVLYHHESISRGYEDTSEKINRFKNELEFMKKRWGKILNNDPFYSPNLTLNYEDFSLSYPPRINY